MYPIQLNMKSRPSIAVLRMPTFVLLMLLLLTGCRGEPTAGPVDESLARQTLRDVLEGWRSGKSVSDWKTQTPVVVVQDADWQSGHRLVGFELLDQGRPLDANLHCTVRLTLRDETSEEFDKEVVYIVGTDPVLTVFRNPFASR